MMALITSGPQVAEVVYATNDLSETTAALATMKIGDIASQGTRRLCLVFPPPWRPRHRLCPVCSPRPPRLKPRPLCRWPPQLDPSARGPVFQHLLVLIEKGNKKTLDAALTSIVRTTPALRARVSFIADS